MFRKPGCKGHETVRVALPENCSSPGHSCFTRVHRNETPALAPMWRWELQMGRVIPSRDTYHTGRGSSPSVVSFPIVAGKLDNFSATY